MDCYHTDGPIRVALEKLDLGDTPAEGEIQLLVVDALNEAHITAIAVADIGDAAVISALGQTHPLLIGARAGYSIGGTRHCFFYTLYQLDKQALTVDVTAEGVDPPLEFIEACRRISRISHRWLTPSTRSH